MEQLIENYGYLAVLIGTFLEGETIVVVAGLAAKFGHLSLQGVVLAALVGTVLGDQLYFFLGRRYGKVILQKKPHWARRAERVDALIGRWDVWLVLGFRFMYGLRSIASFTFGMSRIDSKKFVVLNIVGAVIWAVTVACAGYLLGKGAELLMSDLQEFPLLLAAVAAAGLSVWLLVRIRQRGLRRGAAVGLIRPAPAATSDRPS